MKRFIALSAAAVLFMQMSVSAEQIPQYAPLFEASFLQSWYCRDWTAQQWKTELNDMKQTGFHSVILQSVVDLSYEYDASAGERTDPAAYTLQSSQALYPCSLAGSNVDCRALEYALDAAADSGMQVYIGTVSDSRWWSYGWGVPDAGFETWSEENAAQCSTVIREVWEQFADNYSAQIAGFYYNNEIWNIDAACAGTDDCKYADIIGANIRSSIDAIEQLCPEKPLMLSPFYNKDLSDSASYSTFWNALAEQSGLRQRDIIACQDGGGREYDTDTIAEWNDALQAALSDHMRVWINHETFGQDMLPKPMELLRENYLATASFENHILFSWNHYYHGSMDTEYAKLMQTMTGDLNADGICSKQDAAILRYWLRHDRIAIENWHAGDLHADRSLNASDLTLLKRRLLTE